jgi:hypothetical protein
MEQMKKFDSKHEQAFLKLLRILKFKHIKSTWIAQLKQDLNHRLMMQQYLKQQQDMQLIQASQASLLPLEEQKVVENIHLLPPS